MPNKSNAYLFYGEDDFSIARKAKFWKDEFTKKFSGNAITELDGEKLSEPELISKFKEALTPSLFASKKLILVKNGLPAKASSEALLELVLKAISDLPKDYFLVFCQTTKLDRRLSSTKKIFASIANQTEFNLPHGIQLNGWIQAYVKQKSAAIDSAAVEKLAQFIGRDLGEEKKVGGKVIERIEFFNLWQAHNEIEKLVAYAGNRPITQSDVEKITKPRLPENIFALSDQIVKKDQRSAFRILENLLDSSNIDEKSTLIKIVGLLAEQIRGLLIVATLKQKNLSTDDMAEVLGWNRGRVFITHKHALVSDLPKYKTLLKKLLSIDLDLKSKDVNPKLLMDLFLAQVCS